MTYQVNPQISFDTASYLGVWLIQACTTYKVKGGGEIAVTYYLTKLPLPNAKSLEWSNFRHEARIYMATNLTEAMAKFAIPKIQQDDNFIVKSIPAIKNAELDQVRIRFISLEPNCLKEITVKHPK